MKVTEFRGVVLRDLKEWREHLMSLRRSLMWAQSRLDPETGDTVHVYRVGVVTRAEIGRPVAVTLTVSQSDRSAAHVMVGDTRWRLGEIKELAGLLTQALELAAHRPAADAAGTGMGGEPPMT